MAIDQAGFYEAQHFRCRRIVLVRLFRRFHLLNEARDDFIPRNLSHIRTTESGKFLWQELAQTHDFGIRKNRILRRRRTVFAANPGYGTTNHRFARTRDDELRSDGEIVEGSALLAAFRIAI